MERANARPVQSDPSPKARSSATTTARIVGIHSYRGGSGKTTLAANLAFLAARAGSKVAVVDADLQAPALHLVLGVGTARILHSVSEFVKGQCEIDEVPIDLTLELGLEGTGTLHFLPASPDLHTAASILFEGYDVARLNAHLLRLAAELELDYMVLDTHLGINRESLLSLAISDALLVLVRPDGQDRDGAATLIEIAKKLSVPSCVLVPNMVASDAEREEVRARVEKELGAPVAGTFAWCADLSVRACPTLFAARSPDHPFTQDLEQLARRLMPTGAAMAASRGGA